MQRNNVLLSRDLPAVDYEICQNMIERLEKN